MRKINDMMDHTDISSMKQNSLYELSKEKHIQKFLKENHLNVDMMDDYWVEFLDYNDDYHICLHCSSLNDCPKDNKGMKKSLVVHDDQIVLELSSCVYGKELEKRRLLLNQFVISNVSDELMLTDLKGLNIIKNLQKASPNCKYAVASVLKYIQQPEYLGLFLHGDIESEKTLLLAGLMNSLAKQNKEVGFIHFPTYLIDLKASFSSGENTHAIDRLMSVEYLMLDGIGEENITPWSRDEILLTILSYRLINQLPTFFTSMYGYKELENVYTIKKSDSGDKIRAKTIIQKMKALSNEIMLDGGKMK